MSCSLGAAGSIQHRVVSEINSILTDFLIDLNYEHVGLVVRVFFFRFYPPNYDHLRDEIGLFF